MRHRVLSVSVLVSLTALQGCSRSAGVFSDRNARVHVETLAGTIGSRPAGTPENARARAYVIDQLKLFGYQIRVQETDARRSEFGLTARVANIIAVLPGTRREALGLVSHYDSSPEAPGAADDAFGVAVSLEAARVIASKPRTWTTMVLVTDAEESGLLGAAALVHDPEVRERLHAYLNVEASGSSGPATLFQTGPANHWIVRPWARYAPHPRGGSFAIEVYKRLPNDTDFSILRHQEIPGLNFALIGDSYAYHTARDTPERLSPLALRTTGENVVAIVEALQQADIARRTPTDATYFDIAGTRAVSYSAAFDWTVTAVAVLLGVFAWLRVTRFVVRSEGIGRWILGVVWTAVTVIAVAAAMAGATWVLRSAREVYHPWYAHPNRLFVMLLTVGTFTGWGFVRIGRWIPVRARGIRHPAVVWTYTLPVWTMLALAVGWTAPGAAYLWTVPLLAAGLLLSLTPAARGAFVRVASLLVFAVAGTLWVRDTVDLLHFMVAVFGRLAIITPFYAYAALITAASIVVVPPLLSAAAVEHRLTRPAVVTTVCLLALAVAIPLAYLAPAYTFAEPLRREARALQEEGAPESIWQVGSLEPGLDLGDDAPGQWTPGRSQRSTSIPWGLSRQPFLFSATAPPLGAAPATFASFTIRDVSGGIELAITVAPREPVLSVSFILPGGAVPARSSLPGIVRSGRWSAVYVAPPPEGVAFRASFTGVTAERLRETRVTATSARLPGGEGWQRLPRWLPQDRMVWTLRATWVLQPPAPLEPVPPLR